MQPTLVQTAPVVQPVNTTSQPTPKVVIPPAPTVVTPAPVVQPPVTPMPPITQTSATLPAAPVSVETDDPFAMPKVSSAPVTPIQVTVPVPFVTPTVTTAPTLVPPTVTTTIVETKTVTLPHADATKADPLNTAPELLPNKAKKNVTILTPTTSTTTTDKTKKDATVTTIPTKVTDSKTVTTIPTKPATTPAPLLPMGFGSIYGANRAGVEVVAEQQAHSAPVETTVIEHQPRYSLFPALFGSHRKADGPNNAFFDGGIPPEILARGGGTNMPPPGVAMPPFDAGIAPGWANAFTPVGTTRPIPADFGPVQYPTNAFEDKLAHAMTPPYSAPPVPFHPTMAVPPSTPLEVSRVMTGNTSTPLPLVLVTLKDALYPSQREEAAEHLGTVTDMKKRAEVVAYLVDAAQTDPAGIVRAACVRSLSRLQADSPEVVTVLQTLRNDRDPMVRKEVERVHLPTTGVPVHQDNAVQPVSAKGIPSPIK